MFHAFADMPKAAITVAVFIGAYLLLLTIGRLLKRRAGVRLGIFFQLFCLAAAFYAALWVYGASFTWRNHVGAILILTSTALVVALINRFLWDYYYETRRQVPVPKLLRDTVAVVLFLIALLLVLSVGYHAETQLTGLLAGSGVAAIILGFAAQNLLSSIVAGISLQIQRPYKVGDWLKVGDSYGEVMEIRWGATRLLTNDSIMLHIPNNEIVKQMIVNLTYPSRVHAMRLTIGAEYGAPPNRVKDALYRAARRAPGVVQDPPVQIYLREYADFAIIYEIKFYMTTHTGYFETRDAIYTNLWYEFKRSKITIPFPIRTLHVAPRGRHASQEKLTAAQAILRRDPLFSCLDDEQLKGLLEKSDAKHFGRGEKVIEEGSEGDSMFVLLRGAAQVFVSKNGTEIQVGSLRQGDCFGEMSLLTGEPRTATVQAERDCEVLEIAKSDMATLLEESPDCLEQLSGLLARRKLETEGIVRDATTATEEDREEEYRASFLSRLRTFFEL